MTAWAAAEIISAAIILLDLPLNLVRDVSDSPSGRRPFEREHRSGKCAVHAAADGVAMAPSTAVVSNGGGVTLVVELCMSGTAGWGMRE